MIMDNGRIRLEDSNGVLQCDVYMDDEFSLDDLSVIRQVIRKNYAPSVDIICLNSGSYSVSMEVQKAAVEGIDEFRNIVYVVDGKTKRDSAEFAASTFMKAYNARIVNSVQEAHELLRKTA